MATLFEYKCKSCKYTVAAHPKGHDMIMMGEQYTYHCKDCLEIVHVLYPYGEKPEKIVCTECGSDKIQKWNPKTGKCPKCGGDMNKTDSVLMVD